jgi:hypothetical protein
LGGVSFIAKAFPLGGDYLLEGLLGVHGTKRKTPLALAPKAFRWYFPFMNIHERGRSGLFADPLLGLSPYRRRSGRIPAGLAPVLLLALGLLGRQPVQHRLAAFHVAGRAPHPPGHLLWRGLRVLLLVVADPLEELLFTPVDLFVPDFFFPVGLMRLPGPLAACHVHHRRVELDSLRIAALLGGNLQPLLVSLPRW